MVPIKRRISSYNHRSGRGGESIKYIVVHFTDNENDSAAGNANYFNTGNRDASAHYFVDDKEIYQVVEDHNTAWHVGDGHGKYGISNSNSIGIEMCATNGQASATTQSNTIDLIVVLAKKYGVPFDRIVRHYDASRKICPSPFYPNNWKKWWDFKDRLAKAMGEKPQRPTIVESGSSSSSSSSGGGELWKECINGELIKDLQSELNKQFGAGLKVDGYFGDSTLKACITVKRGAEGNITKIIQKRLLQRGYTSLEPYGATGYFGSVTENAVKALQRNKGLDVDGIVGRNTWKALMRKQ